MRISLLIIFFTLCHIHEGSPFSNQPDFSVNQEMDLKPPVAVFERPSIKNPLSHVFSVNPDPLTSDLHPTPPLRTFHFQTVTINESGGIIRSETKTSETYQEDFGNGVFLEMIFIPGGNSLMGSPENEPCRSSGEGPPRTVSVKPFFMSRYEVTQEQWRVVARYPRMMIELRPEPSRFHGESALPVESVSWEECQEFCRRLSLVSGQEYCLPTEVEWEYACRAGTTTPFHFGPVMTSDLANYDAGTPYASAPKGQCRSRTMPVGRLGYPNAFGLFDMHGNVAEWCQDPFESLSDGKGRIVKPVVNPTTRYRITHGGSWSSPASDCRCAAQVLGDEKGGASGLGFRVVRTLK